MSAVGSGRLFSLDAARGFAVFAMVIAHTSPFIRPAPKAVELVEDALNDVAAPLFALIIGVTVAVTGPAPSTADPSARRRYQLQTAVKAAALIGIGILLELAPSGVNIVLQTLGVTMLLAIPLLFARVRTLLVWAAALMVVGPGIVTGLRVLAESRPELVFPRTPLTVLLDLLALNPGYQVLAFLPLLLAGIAIGRTVLSDRRPMTVLLAVSFAALLPMQLWKSLDLAGTGLRGGYVEVWREAPLALCAFALIVLLTDLASDRVAAMRRVFAPFSVQGRLALSVYAFHVLVLMWLFAVRATASPETLPWFAPPRGWLLQIGLVTACWMFSAAWWRWLGVGPIERVIGALSGRHPWSSVWATSRRTHISRRERTGAPV
ncbi:DUF418 domain-containing protein [Leucobacter sp. CSA1]|uniref:DUF418 domain-containing protein n=1 Tax=Leucobacter chromiisoli TaxID=2796471 RepID=A0A934QA82_9MICO|nr:DUF418 domain-containing protein [Leucobacter chromiisoli]MBK0419469.1 DUF418 domain-containing protein [Leucobacter chromiisoli]